MEWNTPQSFGENHFNTFWLYIGLGFVFLVVDLLTDILGRCTKRMYSRFKNTHFIGRFAGNIKAISYQDAPNNQAIDKNVMDEL